MKRSIFAMMLMMGLVSGVFGVLWRGVSAETPNPNGDCSGPNGTPCVGLNGNVCTHATIQDAITAATNTQGADTIYIPRGTYNQTFGTIEDEQITFVASTANCIAENDFFPRSDFVIDGSTLGSAGDGGVLAVVDGADVTMRGLTLQGGSAANGGNVAVSNAELTLKNTSLLGGLATSSGGNLHVANGGLVFMGDRTVISGGATQFGDGGGIALFNATLQMEDATLGTHVDFGANIAANDGGGIYADNSTITMEQGSLISSATAGGDGGGIYAKDTDVMLDDVFISGNEANGDGGGIFQKGDSATITLHEAGVLFNSATGSGSDGGGIALEGTLEATNAEISQNTVAGIRGGGIWCNQCQGIDLDGVEIRLNEADDGIGLYVESAETSPTSVKINNTLFERNTMPGGSVGRGAGVYALGATVEITDTQFLSNTLPAASGTTSGGGIYVAEGTLQMATVEFRSNMADKGAGFFATTSEVTADDVAFTQNTANDSGGGVALNFSDMTMIGGLVLDNFAHVEGGGISAFHSTLTLLDSTVLFNNTAASQGGGIYLDGTTAQVEDALIEGNLSGGPGVSGYGGGIYATDSTLVLRGTEAQNNASTLSGGAVFLVNGSAEIENSTFSRNAANTGGAMLIARQSTSSTPTTLEIRNTLINDNSAAGNGGGISLSDATGTLENVHLRNNNAAFDGGALYLTRDAALIMKANLSGCQPASLAADTYCSEVRGNSAREGGGIYATVSAIHTSHTAFLENELTIAQSQGTAISATDTDTTLLNTLVANNGTVTQPASTLYLFADILTDTISPLRLHIESTTVANNFGAPILADLLLGDVEIFRSIIQQNSESPLITDNGGTLCSDVAVNASCSNVQEPHTNSCTIGSDDGNPQFFTDPARGALRLRASSPGVDVACAVGNAPITDLDFNARPAGTANDRGAFEFNSIPLAVGLRNQMVANGMLPFVLLTSVVLMTGVTIVIRLRRNSD